MSLEIYLKRGDSLQQCLENLSTDIPETESITILLDSGQYQGILRYNRANPLTIKGLEEVPLQKEDTPLALIQGAYIYGENCEAFAKDTENRALFTLGPKTTTVHLENITIENTHIKKTEDASLGNQAEALCFHNYEGILTVAHCSFISRQDTIHVKGQSYFYDCYITGDVDYIWGYNDISLFENCHIHTRRDNRGDDRIAYVLQARTLAHKMGFLFLNCTFTGSLHRLENPLASKVWIARTSGTGKVDSPDRWDSVALINCTLDETYTSELWTDDNGKTVWPSKGSALCGYREYRCTLKDATTPPHPSNYVLSDSEFRNYYRNTKQILQKHPQLEILSGKCKKSTD